MDVHGFSEVFSKSMVFGPFLPWFLPRGARYKAFALPQVLIVEPAPNPSALQQQAAQVAMERLGRLGPYRGQMAGSIWESEWLIMVSSGY